jgi:peptidoglycan/xylan/chitin deacetylase (PgdA/CDA1 family)
LFYFNKIPKIIRDYYSDYLWRKPKSEKALYLTFDDGPTPEITAWVLAQLEQYQALATFFLLGQNVQLYPEIAHQIIDAGHSIGNHTFSHKDGWKTDQKQYLRNFLKGQQSIKEYTGVQSTLFRPPYGHITRAQARQIMRSHEIVMMDVISGDFDTSLKAEDCLKNVIHKAKAGSIVLMHDSKKAWPRLQGCLPGILAHFQEEGYRFEKL